MQRELAAIALVGLGRVMQEGGPVFQILRGEKGRETPALVFAAPVAEEAGARVVDAQDLADRVEREIGCRRKFVEVEEAAA